MFFIYINIFFYNIAFNLKSIIIYLLLLSFLKSFFLKVITILLLKSL